MRRLTIGTTVALILFGAAAVARQTDGVVDPGFGRAGEVRRIYATGITGTDAAKARDGGAYVAASPVQSAGRPGTVLVLRYDRRGRLAKRFARRGVATVRVAGGPAVVRSIAVQRDGRLILAGALGDSPTRAFVARLTRQGRLDATFGADGIRELTFGDRSQTATDSAVDGDGRVVVVGTIGASRPAQGTTSSAFVTRLDAAGAPDTSFGGGGSAVFDPPTESYIDFQAVTLQQDGSLVVAGNTGNVARDLNLATVARLLPNGAPDPGVSPDGFSYPGLGNGVVRGLAQDVRHKRFYLVGNVLGGDYPGVTADSEVFITATDLHLRAIPSFGTGGFAHLRFRKHAFDVAHTALVDRKGLLVVAGTSMDPPNVPRRGRFALSRLRPSGQVDRAFGSRGRLVLDMGRGIHAIRALTVSGHGLIATGDRKASVDLSDWPTALELTRVRLTR